MDPRIRELIDTVLAAGRLGGPMAAAEIWLANLGNPHNNSDDLRKATRTLRMVAMTADERDVDLLTSEYISEMVTLKLKLRQHGHEMTRPSQIEEWFHSKAHRERQAQFHPADQPFKPSPTTKSRVDQALEERARIFRDLGKL